MSWIPLAAGIAALGVAPLIIALLRPWSRSLSFLDGFIFVAMGGLILLDILPESVERVGWTALLLAGVGLMAPAWLESVFRNLGRQVHLAAMALAVVGMLLHAAVDGLALNPLHLLSVGAVRDPTATEAIEALPVAVVLHRLPVGLTLWWILRRRFSLVVPTVALIAMSAATIFGYTAGRGLVDSISPSGMAIFQAFVAGSLLHVLFHRPHPEGDECTHRHAEAGNGLFEGSGAILGGILVFFLIGDHFAEVEPGVVAHFGSRLYSLALIVSLPILIAFFGAGCLSAGLSRMRSPAAGVGLAATLVSVIGGGAKAASGRISDRAGPWIALTLPILALSRNLDLSAVIEGKFRRLQVAALGVLLVLLAGSVLRRGPRHFIAEVFGSRGDTEHD